MQTLTIDTENPYRQRFETRGMNSGRNFKIKRGFVVVCGNEQITANQDYESYGHQIASVQGISDLLIASAADLTEDSNIWFFKD